MILRIIKSAWNLILFYILAYIIATKASNSIGAIVNNGSFVFEHTNLYNQLQSIFGSELTVLFEKSFLFDAKIRFFIFFGMIVFFYSSIMAKHQRSITNKNVYTIIYSTPKSYINKIIGFNKTGWFWLICFFTNFIPILLPLAVWLIARIALGLFAFVVSPIIYPVSHVLLAINGTIK